MRTPPPSGARGGFTLIEMLTVLVVFGIMVSIAAPSLSGLIAVNKVERARDQMIADLAYARILAVRSGRGSTVCVSGGNTYEILQGEVDCSATGAKLAKRVQLGSDYPGIQVTPTAVCLRFNSRGLVPSGSSCGAAGVEVTIAQGERSVAFEVTGIGTVIRND